MGDGHSGILRRLDGGLERTEEEVCRETVRRGNLPRLGGLGRIHGANGLEHRATFDAVKALDALGDVVIKLVLDLDAHDRHAATLLASKREVADVRTSGGKDVRHAGDEARFVCVTHDECALEAGDAHAHAIDASDLDLTATDGTAEHGHALALRRGELNQGGVGMEALVLVIANHKGDLDPALVRKVEGVTQAHVIRMESEGAGDEGAVRAVTAVGLRE